MCPKRQTPATASPLSFSVSMGWTSSSQCFAQNLGSPHWGAPLEFPMGFLREVLSTASFSSHLKYRLSHLNPPPALPESNTQLLSKAVQMRWWDSASSLETPEPGPGTRRSSVSWAWHLPPRCLLGLAPTAVASPRPGTHPSCPDTLLSVWCHHCVT